MLYVVLNRFLNMAAANKTAAAQSQTIQVR